MAPTSFTEIYCRALRGHPIDVVGIKNDPYPLPVRDWLRPADAVDHELLDLCTGSTLDVGCGPGRLTHALALRGQKALGVDIVHEAVRQTVARGAAAAHQDVFDEVPGEGLWETVLLADGNIGIGGDPVALLARARELIRPTGRIVVEVKAPGVPMATHWVALQCSETRSRPFRWAVVGMDDIDRLAQGSRLVVAQRARVGTRWAVALERPR